MTSDNFRTTLKRANLLLPVHSPVYASLLLCLPFQPTTKASALRLISVSCVRANMQRFGKTFPSLRCRVISAFVFGLLLLGMEVHAHAERQASVSVGLQEEMLKTSFDRGLRKRAAGTTGSRSSRKLYSRRLHARGEWKEGS